MPSTGGDAWLPRNPGSYSSHLAPFHFGGQLHSNFPAADSRQSPPLRQSGQLVPLPPTPPSSSVTRSQKLPAVPRGQTQLRPRHWPPLRQGLLSPQLLLAQVSPQKPSWQTHVGPRTPSWQTPPLRHGSEEQGSTLSSQCRPAWPSRQSQR